MNKLIKKSKFLYLFALLAFGISFPTSYVEAQSSDQKKQIFLPEVLFLETESIFPSLKYNQFIQEELKREVPKGLQ